MRSMDWKDRIELNEEVLAGKPVVKGTRLAVEFIVELLAEGWSEAQVLENYPNLTSEDVRGCLKYASAVPQVERAIPAEPR